MADSIVPAPTSFDELLMRAENYFMEKSLGISPNSFHQAAEEVLVPNMSMETVVALLADGRHQYPGIQGTFGHVSAGGTSPLVIRKWLLHGLLVTRLSQCHRIKEVLQGFNCTVNSHGIIEYPPQTPT